MIRRLAPLGFLAAALLILASAATPAVGADEQVVKLATLIPSGSVWDKTLKTMAADWQAASGGRMRLRIYPGGVAGDDPDVVRKMRIGQLQAATVTVTGLTEIDPAFAVFEIPMFFESFDELFHVLGELEPELRRRLEERGFHLLHWGHAGWVYFFSTEPASTLDEFRALDVFVWAGNDKMSAIWRDLEFRPVPLAATDILTGLKTGMFDALPSTPIAALSLQWFRSAPYMLDLGITPLLAATVITRRSWDRLEPADRRSLSEAAARAERTFVEEIPAQDARAIEEMERRGLTVLRIAGTPAERAWQNEALRFADRMSAEFVPPEIYDRAARTRDEFRNGGR